MKGREKGREEGRKEGMRKKVKRGRIKEGRGSKKGREEGRKKEGRPKSGNKSCFITALNFRAAKEVIDRI